jgi:N-acetyl-gamma-glutamyl-phosphate reductase/acetylglutamate kinase
MLLARRALFLARHPRPSVLQRRLIHSVAQTDRVLVIASFIVLFLHFFFSQETITRLLYSIGTKREVERYLRIFSSSSNPSHPAKFAVIKVGGGVLGQLDELALSLSFLYRVGLYPVIIHGGGPQLNEIIERGGIVPEYIDGIRVTGAPFSLLPVRLLILPKMQKPYRLLAVCS